MTTDKSNPNDLSEKAEKIETTKGDYRHIQTILIGLIGLLFSLSQICALIPEIIRNAEELQLFSKSIAGWGQLLSNITFVLSCLCSSSILAFFLLGVWITATVHVGTQKVLLKAEKGNWLIRFYNFVMNKVLPTKLKNWIETLLAG
jgi:hypothetical protein